MITTLDRIFSFFVVVPDHLIFSFPSWQGMLRIASASSFKNMLWIRSGFHLFSLSISTATVASGGKFGVKIGLKVDGLGIQLLLKTEIFFPLPILHLYPFSITCLPHIILLQMYDGFDPIGAFKKSVSLKYLALSTLAASELWF